jgi:hypothetical protein
MASNPVSAYPLATGESTRWFASLVGQRGDVAAVDFCCVISNVPLSFAASNSVIAFAACGHPPRRWCV